MVVTRRLFSSHPPEYLSSRRDATGTIVTLRQLGSLIMGTRCRAVSILGSKLRCKPFTGRYRWRLMESRLHRLVERPSNLLSYLGYLRELEASTFAVNFTCISDNGLGSRYFPSIYRHTFRNSPWLRPARSCVNSALVTFTFNYRATKRWNNNIDDDNIAIEAQPARARRVGSVDGSEDGPLVASTIRG